jgi:hypothetical protein
VRLAALSSVSRASARRLDRARGRFRQRFDVPHPVTFASLASLLSLSRIRTVGQPCVVPPRAGRQGQETGPDWCARSWQVVLGRRFVVGHGGLTPIARTRVAWVFPSAVATWHWTVLALCACGRSGRPPPSTGALPPTTSYFASFKSSRARCTPAATDAPAISSPTIRSSTAPTYLTRSSSGRLPP